MINQHYIHPDDAVTEATDSGVMLFDAEGDLRHTFPPGFSDAHIQAALVLVNLAYRQGQRIGRQNFQHELRELIGSPHPTKDRAV